MNDSHTARDQTPDLGPKAGRSFVSMFRRSFPNSIWERAGLRLCLAPLILSLFSLVLFCAPTRASDLIPGKFFGTSAIVTQPHVTAELIPESTSLIADSLDVILHLHMDEGWHTYWINPGEAGLATRINWTLPLGFSAGPIQWPTPEVHAMGPVTTFGYAGDVYLLTTITLPKGFTGKFQIKAKASWLVCQEECIPGRGEFTLDLQKLDPSKEMGGALAANGALFRAARARLPVPNTRWIATGNYGERAEFNSLNHPGFNLQLKETNPSSALLPKVLRFFPEQGNVLGDALSDQGATYGDAQQIALSTNLAQNGEKPDHLSGVLVSDVPLIGKAKAVYISSFPVTGAEAAAKPPESVEALVPPSTAAQGPVASPTIKTAPPYLIAVLGAAFLGGLILNLMPCVLPVLSLKVFSLVRHAGDHPGSAWKQGVAFTAGVVVSFWALAGLLLILKAAGNQLGWGFQMQSPGFVLALIYLFFVLGLNLFGVFELGTSLVGLDAKASSNLGGFTSSFANGALATLAATPCTAPFMGSSIGFAAQQPAYIALLVFTILALGMATPYLLLTVFPGALRFVPKPGPWMEAFKQFMGFLLMATVIFLTYVFGALVGQEAVPSLLGALLLVGVATWIYGRWGSPLHPTPIRLTAFAFAAIAFLYSLTWGVALARETPPVTAPMLGEGWQPYSADAVAKALADNQPAFVDFTAAWCLSCKVNERVALDVDSTRQAFKDNHVALFRGDWTHSDPVITQTLRQFNRDGVPLYLLYSPKNPTAPQVLPEVLTPGIVEEALQKL